MDYLYIPNELINARKDIEILHANKAKVEIKENDNALYELIHAIVNKPVEKIKRYSITLTENELSMVASYIPHNYFQVDMTNLFEVFRYRSNRRMCNSLFIQWQNRYDYSECNDFLCRINEYENNYSELMKEYNFSDGLFFEILKHEDIPFRLVEELLTVVNDSTMKFNEKLNYFGIRENTVIYRDCEYYFYAFCKREDYIKNNDNEMIKIVSKYFDKDYILKQFLKNFLSELSIADLNKYLYLARAISNKVGKFNSASYKQIFESFPSDIEQKYKDWINLWAIYAAFGDDERSKFWKQFRFYGVSRYGECLVMRFKDYYALEFIGPSMGRIYIIQDYLYDSKVRWWIRNLSLTDLKSRLYSNRESYYMHKVHQGEWQQVISSVLILNKITERILPMY